MGLWNKLFGKRNVSRPSEAKSPYLPKKKEEIEVLFADHFTQKGGKFLYSENAQTTHEFFQLILEENLWKEDDILCFDEAFSQSFGLKILTEDPQPKQYKALLIGCEYLIANKGTLLICHHQLKDYKLEELPDFFIVFSGVKNFVNDVSEGMSKLKNKYSNQVPSNITTLNVRNVQNEKDFLSYGNSAKNLYLVLQE